MADDRVDDLREDDPDIPAAGRVVPPISDFEDLEQKDPNQVDGVAGIAGDDDLLSDEATIPDLDLLKGKQPDKPNVENKSVPDVASVAEEALKPLVKENPMKMPDKAPDVIKTPAPPEKIASKVPKPPEADSKAETDKKKSTIKMSPEQIEKAKAAREAATKAAEEETEKKKKQAENIIKRATDIVMKIGEKSKAFELGETSRAKAEAFVENTIKAGVEEEASQQDKLKGSAASAAKSVVATLTKAWEGTATPKIREQLPPGYDSLSNKTIASVIVGLFVTLLCLPSLFSGGAKPKPVVKARLDQDAIKLEKRLQRERAARSSYSSQSTAEKSVFPPETSGPSSKSSVPATSLSSVPKVNTPAPTPVTPPPPPPKPVAEIPKPTPKPEEPLKPAVVTPTMAVSTVTRAIGPRASLVSSASFDSLADEPTIVFQVSEAFHKLPAAEQKQIAQKMLISVKPLGYERISLVETSSQREVAHAGVDVDLEDEAQNLRAELQSLRATTDKLAVQAATDEADIGSLRSRLAEERDEFAAKQIVTGKIMQGIRNDNAGLVQDLTEAKEEISKIPDRFALEERTLYAERQSEKMGDTVEMLSIQLSKVRAEEAQSKQSEAQAIEASRNAVKDKESTLASVAVEIKQAQEAAENRANSRIAVTERDADQTVAAANKHVEELENTLSKTTTEAESKLQQTTTSFEKQISNIKEKDEKEEQTVQNKYEKMLDEIQRKAQADLDSFQKEADRNMGSAMKEAKSFSNSLTKERDQAIKETEKVEGKAEKAATKAEKEKQGLQKRIDRLEAKLKGKEVVEDKVESAVEGGN